MGDIPSSNMTNLDHSNWLVWELWLFPISRFLRQPGSNLVLCSCMELEYMRTYFYTLTLSSGAECRDLVQNNDL